MHKELSYNLHNILNFKIVTSSRLKILNDLNFMFSYFESEKNNSDVILNIGKFTPSDEHSTLVDHKYHIKDNYFYCKDKEGKAKWEVEIFGFEDGPTHINFHSVIYGIEQLLIPDYLAQNIILRPLLELKLFEKGYVTLHGLGIEKNGKACVFAARGGAHKTRIAMDLLRKGGYSLLGDDRLICSQDYLFSYPLFYNLVKFKAEHMNDEHISSLPNKIKMIAHLNSKAFNAKNSSLFTNKARFEKIFLMARKENFVELSYSDVDLDSLAKAIVNSNKMEFISSGISQSLGFVPFYRYMLAYSYVFPDSKIATYWDNLEIKIKEVLRGKIACGITLPDAYSPALFIDLFNLVNGA